MKKKLNTSSLLEEFQQDSEFFKRTRAAPSAPELPVSPPPPVGPVPAPDTVRTVVRTPSPRDMKRHAFEFYRDQLEALKQLAFEDVRTKGQGNMSSMVRDALDEYLAKRGITLPTE